MLKYAMKNDTNISNIKIYHATNKQDIPYNYFTEMWYILCRTAPPRQDILHTLFKESENKHALLASYFSGMKYMN